MRYHNLLHPVLDTGLESGMPRRGFNNPTGEALGQETVIEG
jgi:hypothetical protein